MMGDQDNLTIIMERRLAQKVEPGDNHSYAVKGIGRASFELELADNIHLNNILYMSGLKKNLFLFHVLNKRERVALFNGKFLVWPKGFSIDSVRVIRVCE